MKIFCFYLNKDDLQIKVNNGKIAYKQQENKTVSKTIRTGNAKISK